jgi:glycolate oxidase
MVEYSPINDEIRERILTQVGSECILTDPQAIEEFSRDESTLNHRPELVVEARSAEQVSQLLTLANKYRFPVTPRGAGTGLAGGALPVHGGVVLSLAGMNRIKSIDTRNLIAEVEPGVITKALRDAAQQKGLFYPPDPASLDKSTVGGNAATNAGGPACVKYGTTRDYILGLEGVLPSGKMISAGVKTRKGVVGYDMTHLLVGSEGTLGVITGLILKLIPYPPAVRCQAAVFPDLHSAIEAVTQIMARGHLPSAVEFMDYRCLDLVGDLLPFQIPGENASLLILETDGHPEQVDKEITKIGEVCVDLGATHLMAATNTDDRERIWEVRRQVSQRIHEHWDLYVPEDVVVPIGRIAELVDLLPAYERKYNMVIYAFGHAGDGNIHLNFTAKNHSQLQLVERGIKGILEEILFMDGTISGEHGIGLAKKQFLPLELAGEAIDLQKGIKRLFDPNMILNPGKIFD